MKNVKKIKSIKKVKRYHFFTFIKKGVRKMKNVPQEDADIYVRGKYFKIETWGQFGVVAALEHDEMVADIGFLVPIPEIERRLYVQLGPFRCEKHEKKMKCEVCQDKRKIGDLNCPACVTLESDEKDVTPESEPEENVRPTQLDLLS